MFVKLEDLEVYTLAETLSDEIWNIVTKWEWFERDTVGKQLVRSVDSITANISEGYGRYFYKENIQFCYYARGSLIETKNWLRRAVKRGLLSEEQFALLLDRIENIGKKLNAYINSIRKQSYQSGSNDKSKIKNRQITSDQLTND